MTAEAFHDMTRNDRQDWSSIPSRLVRTPADLIRLSQPGADQLYRLYTAPQGEASATDVTPTEESNIDRVTDAFQHTAGRVAIGLEHEIQELMGAAPSPVADLSHENEIAARLARMSAAQHPGPSALAA